MCCVGCTVSLSLTPTLSLLRSSALILWLSFLNFGLQTSQDIRKRVKAGHVMTYAEHAHLERGAIVSSTWFLAGRAIVQRVVLHSLHAPPSLFTLGTFS